VVKLVVILAILCALPAFLLFGRAGDTRDSAAARQQSACDQARAALPREQQAELDAALKISGC
jgi:hypothetical protein